MEIPGKSKCSGGKRGGACQLSLALYLCHLLHSLPLPWKADQVFLCFRASLSTDLGKLLDQGPVLGSAEDQCWCGGWQEAHDVTCSTPLGGTALPVPMQVAHIGGLEIVRLILL